MGCGKLLRRVPWRYRQNRPHRSVFGPFVIDLATGKLLKNGVRVRLSGQPLQIFLVLLANPGKLVTREQLRKELAANRANALHSTGPVTDEGKAKSSMNAVKTGLTVLLSSDDAVNYQQQLDRHFSELSPATDRERSLVQIVAGAEMASPPHSPARSQ
jgi:hypothetical protein